MKSGEEAWRLLYSIVEDKELMLTMRASGNPACQWFIGWIDEVYYPWLQRGRRGSLHSPAAHSTQFFPLIDKALAAAERDMTATAGAFAKLWPPAWPSDLPDEPMLPGVDWREQIRPKKPRRQGKRKKAH
jgi:hypothetical protein